MKTKTVELKTIKVDKDFNARHIVSDDSGEHAKAAQTIEELAKAIKKDGQLTPVLVSTRKDGNYDLIAGFRRLAAIKSLPNISTIVISVVEPKTRMDAFLLNLKENMARKDLTSYEVGARCAMLLKDNDKLRKGGKAKKGTTATLSSELGISHRYLNRLIRVINGCHPTILKAWSNNDGRCNLRDLEKWASLKHAEQISMFKEAGGAGNGKKSGARQGSDKPPKRANNELITLAIQAANGASADTRYKQGVVAALRWVVGEDDAIPEIFDPAAITTAKKEAKEKTKKETAAKRRKGKKAKLKAQYEHMDHDTAVTNCEICVKESADAGLA